MQLTSSSLGRVSNGPAYPWCSPPCAVVAVVVALGGIFVLDRATGDAPVQHLYYLPIIVAALTFGRPGGIAASLAATTDDLTGLHNLRSFEARFAQLLRAARREKVPLSLLVLDVDRLKSLNDRYGHIAGAEAVRTIGQLIAAHLPSDAVACRYGGDEFVIALPCCTAACAEEIAFGLCQAVSAAAPVLAGHHLPAATLSISVGVACRAFDARAARIRVAGADDQEGEALFRAADDALYKAKAGGRNRVCSAQLSCDGAWARRAVTGTRDRS